MRRAGLGGWGLAPMANPRSPDRPAAAMPASRAASRGFGVSAAVSVPARPAKPGRALGAQLDLFADASAPAAPADEGPAQPA